MTQHFSFCLQPVIHCVSIHPATSFTVKTEDDPPTVPLDGTSIVIVEDEDHIWNTTLFSFPRDAVVSGRVQTSFHSELAAFAST